MKVKYLLIPLTVLLIPSCVVAQTPDPGLAGPYSVVKATYDLGDLAYKPPSFPNNVEVRGSVHYPVPLSAGPFPVLVFLHGRHSTCYKTSTPTMTSLSWPCAAGYQSIISFDGYDYLARTMASHGYIVISISANAINAADASLSDFGMQARAELLQHHLDLWNTFNTTGAAPFDTLFVGKLDMNNIGTMGHSRGGEGVVTHALYNKSLGSPYGIKAVLTLAPVDFKRKILNGIPLMNIAPYCDGDVSNIQGVHFYDDARYNDTTDNAPKYSVLMMGANHNFFNTVWTPGSYIAGGSDDWSSFYGTTDPQCGSTSPGKRFDTTTQKAALNAYAAAFFRTHIGHEDSFGSLLQVKIVIPPASTNLDSTKLFVSYQPPRASRLDVNRTDTLSAITTNTLTGSVLQNGLLSLSECGAGFTMPACAVSTYSSQEPHKGTSTTRGLGETAIRWNDTTDWYQNEMPVANENIGFYKRILFRAAVNFKETTTGTNLDFNVQLIDSEGNTSSQPVKKFSPALFYEPGSTTSELPKVTFNTISIPLSSFTGVDKKKIRYIRFLFNKNAAGSILISDLALEMSVCGKFEANYSFSADTKYHVHFTDQSLKNNGDSLTWTWNFGDPSSGSSNISSVPNPLHTYSGPGTYNSCLYLKTYRSGGLVCADTICQQITLVPNDVKNISKQQITIGPNPARNYLHIEGASQSDELIILDLYGRELYKTQIKDAIVYLPGSIPTGVYCAIVQSGSSTIHQKLVIER